MFQKLFIVTSLIFFTSSATFADLSKDNVRSILRSANGISAAKAEAIINKMEQEYGSTADGTQLKISALLHGSRSNSFGIFKDRKMWNFDVTFTPQGTQEVITVPNLVKAEVFKGGFKSYVAAYDWMWIALPNGMTVEDLDGYKTKRGVSFSPWGVGKFIAGFVYPISLPAQLLLNTVDATVGQISDVKGNINVYTFGIGLSNTTTISFPKFHFSVNNDLLRR